ncbi:hypothetical protein LC065_13295 [Halobacillus litoralis]|uniref:hypothetical protein n=1 Tax=Halobacillus litoralis TaxID=45668 RepID=UPI001CFE8F2D|nr:hypothetical protein [Halobacillus litoralis]WLR46543.1 hypothetical protein LC065_13295 [Halobacillus litoralis]
MQDIYKLDEFLSVEYMKKLLRQNGRKIVHTPSNLEDILAYYKHQLKEAENSPFIVDKSPQIEIKVPVGNNDFYKMKWSLSKARYLTEKNNIEPEEIPLNRLDPSLKLFPDSSTAEVVNEKIFIASYPPIPVKCVLLDGRNEVLKLKKKGVKKTEVLVLHPSEHMKAMSGDVYRRLFAIHFNHSLLCSHLCGDLSIEDLNERLFPVY